MSQVVKEVNQSPLVAAGFLPMWPSSQPHRPWSRQCADRDYMDVCSRYAIPGQDYCENHIGSYGLAIESVCLCGSTRFWETFRDVGLDLTMAGIVVLTIGICAPDSMVLANPDSDQAKRQKAMLDMLHKHKINLATQVLVLNVDGYIGDSTRSEIAHAEARRKVIKWLFPDKR
jgi:hypothetical protein